eukprot:GHVU01126349.1.p4 GENE.GHVU01126349.1~~GHVU01126349.1.p4  ORF type:complete len:115 (+),score=15.26 GHVU01126349.1:724-1068(+)
MLRLFEATVESGEVRGDRAARWLVHVVRGRLQGAQRLADTKLTADKFVTLLRFIQDGRLTEKVRVLEHIGSSLKMQMHRIYVQHSRTHTHTNAHTHAHTHTHTHMHTHMLTAYV